MADDFYLVDLAFQSDFVITPAGDLETITGLDNLKQALFHRLITQPGTLIHRPNYGVGIKSFQNSVNSAANQAEIFSRVREQFSKDTRVEEVTGIQFKINDTRPDMLQIIIKVKPKGYSEQIMGFLPFEEVV